LGVRVDRVGAFELLVHVVAVAGRVGATCLGLVLQARCVRRLGVGLGRSDAGLGGGLLGEGFALPHRVGLFGGFVTDIPGLDTTVFGALMARHHPEGDENQNYGDREERDHDDGAGSHYWLLGLVERWYIVEIGGDAVVVVGGDESRAIDSSGQSV
jgi:hypothetical protein